MINMKLTYEIYRRRKGDPLYCFPLRMFLGHNGLIENHPLKGKTFIHLDDGVEFRVDDVHAHWYKGWYMVALVQNKEQSHWIINWNINCEIADDISNIDGFKLKDFEYDFKKDAK